MTVEECCDFIKNSNTVIDLCIVDVKQDYETILETTSSIFMGYIGNSMPINLKDSLFIKKPIKESQLINSITTFFNSLTVNNQEDCSPAKRSSMQYIIIFINLLLFIIFPLNLLFFP